MLVTVFAGCVPASGAVHAPRFGASGAVHARIRSAPGARNPLRCTRAGVAASTALAREFAMPLALVHSRALRGLEAPAVTVEVHLANGLPSFTLVGLADTEVKESRERVRAAL